MAMLAELVDGVTASTPPRPLTAAAVSPSAGSSPRTTTSADAAG